MTIRLSSQAIDNIVENVMQMVNQSKDEVFEMTEEGRKEYEYLLGN